MADMLLDTAANSPIHILSGTHSMVCFIPVNDKVPSSDCSHYNQERGYRNKMPTEKVASYTAKFMTLKLSVW